jgi:predicted DNA-binding WGR domain protein
MKNYFEYQDEKSSKFWEITVEGTTLKTRYGKIGTTGQTTEKVFADEAAVQKEYAKLVKEKTGKGYVVVGDLIDLATWEKIGADMFVRDCTMGFENNRLGFLLVEEIAPDEDMSDGWRTRLLAVRTNAPMEERFYSRSGTGLSFASISSAWAPNQSEFIAVDILRRAWTYKPKEYKGSEPDIPFVPGKLKPDAYGEFDSAINKVVRVGTTVFAVGSPARIFERVNQQRWYEHKDIPIPAELGSPDREVFLADDSMFRDLAGYSTQDMYAVGGGGSIWHRKGTVWKQMSFPCNLRLYTVACAADGFVYISDIRGSIWKGREDKWELIVKSDLSLPFTDSAWFDDRLWLANEYGTWVLEGNSLTPAHSAKNKPMPASSAVHAHRLDVSPDGTRMLVAGGKGASLFDGKAWQVLFDFTNFT